MIGQADTTTDVWPVVVAIITMCGVGVAIVGGLLSIRREQRAATAEQMKATIEDREWRAEIRGEVARVAGRVDRIGVYFESVPLGGEDLSLPAQVRDLRTAVTDTRRQMAELDVVTRGHMSQEAERWTAESTSREADSREIRDTLRTGLQKVHDRIDETAKQVGATAFDVAHLASQYAEHTGDAETRDARIQTLEAEVVSLRAQIKEALHV